MIIKSISLKNFQCYFGAHEDNYFEFEEGINLVIGENGGGKSKLFDAFYWALYDQIFQSDTREFVYTRNYKDKIISDKAKKVCPVGEELSTEIVLVVEDSQGNIYRIMRIYRAKKVDEDKWHADNASKLIIQEYKITRWQNIAEDRYDSILKRVITGVLKPYMWFQGEQVDSLMDFQDKSSLMQAINLLSNIHEYDEITDIALAGSTKAMASYAKEAKKLSRNKEETTKLSNSLEDVLKDIKKAEESKSNYEKQRNIAQTKIEGLINKIDDAERKAALKARRHVRVEEIDNERQKLNECVEGLNKKLFTDFWLLKDVKPIFQEYSEKYNNYFQGHLAKINAANGVLLELPIDIPQPIHVSKMLADEKCFVCGREAEKGSKAYEHIEHLLNRKKEETKDIFQNDCSSFFQKIYNNAIEFKYTIDNIQKNIGQEFTKISNLKSSLDSKALDLKAIDKEFDQLVADDRSDDVVKEYRMHNQNMEKFTNLLAQEQKNLDHLRDREKGIESSLDKLVVGEVDSVITASRDIWNILHQVTTSTREDVFTGLIAELESSANAIFHKMTERNNSITGRLKLKMLSPDSCVPEIVDSEGSVLYGSNDSNIILVKLALIMAVVTSREVWSRHYTLISDAPTSKMAKNYAYGFYSALGENYKQSIVMTYDFLSEEDRSVLKNFKMGNIYRINSIYPEGNREDRTELSISVSKVSL